jgi:predicted DsbA family dithiol-disulfide isomerase
MPSILVEFFYDYVDPLSWLVDRRLTAALSDRPAAGVTLSRFPLEMRPPPEPMMAPDDADLVRRRTAVKKADPTLGSLLRPPVIVPWTRKAHELAAHAEGAGLFDRVHTALFSAHLSGGLDIGRVDVLVKLAEKETLDSSEAKVVLDVDRYLERVRTTRSEVLARGISEVPTLLVDGSPVSNARLLEHPAGSVLEWLHRPNHEG